MKIYEQKIKGVKGKTVIYTYDLFENKEKIIIKNLTFNNPYGEIKYKTPIRIKIIREDVDKSINVKVFLSKEREKLIIEEIYILDPDINTEQIKGNEGDIILTVFIPSDVNKDIEIYKKEVKNED